MQKEQKSNLLGISIIILVGIFLIGGLYLFGNTKKTNKTTEKEPVSDVLFADYENIQLQKIPKSDADKVRALLSELTLNPDLANYIALSKTWEAIGNYPLGAYYYYKGKENFIDSLSWITAGDKLYNSYKNYSDTLVTNNLLTFALASYKSAMNSNKDDIAIRMKLAKTYVESPTPMEGIILMREIIDSIPSYAPALMELGRLSLQTGQYDKAVSRFKTILETDPTDTEAMYFLALSYEGLGNIDECIKLLTACKALVNIPEFSAEIDDFINDLKNK